MHSRPGTKRRPIEALLLICCVALFGSMLACGGGSANNLSGSGGGGWLRWSGADLEAAVAAGVEAVEGRRRWAASIPQVQHFAIVVLENSDYSDIVGSPNAPYINSLIAQGGLAGNYYANVHPSIGNYFVMTTGVAYSIDDNFSGIVPIDNVVRELHGRIEVVEGVCPKPAEPRLSRRRCLSLPSSPQSDLVFFRCPAAIATES